jgi:XTP/dITP diphosphohydrolase
LLADLPLRVYTPAQLGKPFEVAEDGSTYLENARAKAAVGLRVSGMPSLGEDTGLEVAALGGEPGLHSRRWAGENSSDAERRRALLDALGPLTSSRPSARFRCVAVLMLPDGRKFEGEGILEGAIAAEPRGEHGFGYDPIFVLPDGRRLAELSLEEKNLLSHRARALTALEVRGAFDALLSSSS